MWCTMPPAAWGLQPSGVWGQSLGHLAGTSQDRRRPEAWGTGAASGPRGQVEGGLRVEHGRWQAWFCCAGPGPPSLDSGDRQLTAKMRDPLLRHRAFQKLPWGSGCGRGPARHGRGWGPAAVPLLDHVV